MATEVTVPTLGESITVGLIAAWHVKDGDYIQAEQPLYELETDKITSEATAAVAGRISLKAAEGDEVNIGQVIAIIDENAVAPPDSAADPGGDSAESRKTAMAAATESAAERPPDVRVADIQIQTASDSESTEDHDEAADAPPLSPAVRRLAAETGIDTARIIGTGKAGRPTKGDLLATMRDDASTDTAKPGLPPADAEVSAPHATPIQVVTKGQSDRSTTRRKMSPLRRRIAERLVEAQRTAAILTTFNEADMTAVMELRKKHQNAFTDRHGIKLGFMSFFVKACVYALREVPAINASIDGAEVVENHFFDIGVAVSTEKGLMVPVIRDCENLSFAEIESQIAGYARKAREGKVTVNDLQGGVFTITNGGIFGSLLSTPIINQPQSGILGMHTIQERPVVLGGEIVARPMMYLALSYDHRLVDGREAVTFLIRIKEAIEDPTRLLLQV
jgi:2-oxoglutarate dehydrogenase E2 component (dihydrolipoamide succinyltransferase)